MQCECGFRFGQALQSGAITLEISVALRENAFGNGRDFLRGAAQFIGRLAQAHKIMARDAFGAAAAEKFYAPILADFGTTAHEERADLASALDVSAAARLEVGSFDFDGAENTFAVDFLSNANLRQLVGRAIANVDGAVFKNDFVCGALGAFQYFFRWFGAAQVDRANFGSQMEGNGGKPEAFLEHCREKMLAGVLLHVIEAARPVDAPLHFASLDGLVDEVDDFFAIVADVENIGIAQFCPDRAVARRKWDKTPCDRGQLPMPGLWLRAMQRSKRGRSSLRGQ